jgi:tetratricopeptide (TPR) repeat protein
MSMAKSTKEAFSFIKSISILTLVGLVALITLYPKTEEVTPFQDDLVANLAQSKRDSMRHAAAMVSAIKRNKIGEYNYGSGNEPKSADTEIAKHKQPLMVNAPDFNAGKFNEVNENNGSGFNPDVQAAIDLIDNGQVQEAVDKLKEILAKDPTNEQALVEMAMIQLLDLKNSGEAINYLQKVVGVNPDNRIVISELVSLYEEDGRVEEGLSFLRGSMNNQNSGEINYGIGQLLSMQGRTDEAISHLEKAIGSNVGSFRAQKELADAYSAVGRMDKAIGAYEKTIADQGRDIEKREKDGMPSSFAKEKLGYNKLDLARALIKNGQLDEAQNILDEVSSSLPDATAISSVQKRIDLARG